MANVNFRQGEDVKLLLQIKKDGVTIDVSSAPKIKCHLMKPDNTLVWKYSLLEETDYGKLEVDSINNYQVNVLVERSESKNFPVGLLKAVVAVSFIDTDFPDGIRVQEYSFTPAYVLKGNLLDEDMDVIP